MNPILRMIILAGTDWITSSTIYQFLFSKLFNSTSIFTDFVQSELDRDAI